MPTDRPFPGADHPGRGDGGPDDPFTPGPADAPAPPAAWVAPPPASDSLAAPRDARPSDPPLSGALGARHEGGEPAGGASTRLLVVVSFVSLVADLGTKAWAKGMLTGPGSVRRITAIPNVLDFVYAQNPGGAWSMLRGMPEVLRRPFFLFVSAAAIVFIVRVYRHVRPTQIAMKWGLPLALGGALGNLVDRIRYGSVIDFIDMYARIDGRERHWPTYNVADIAIVVGVVLMALDSFIPRAQRAAAAASMHPPNDDPSRASPETSALPATAQPVLAAPSEPTRPPAS